MTVQELIQRATRAEKIESQLSYLETRTWAIDAISFTNKSVIEKELVQQIFEAGLKEIKIALRNELESLLTDWSEE